MKGKKATTAAPSARAMLTSLPEGVVEMIVDHLYGNDKAHLAVSCKALLPILGMGHVRVNLDKPVAGGRRPLHKASRYLTKQPGGVAHLEVFVLDHNASVERECFGSRHLIDLSLLSNLRELTVESIAITLPALQPVAARLRALDIFGSRLQGSSDGFLTKGWTALTSLRLTHTHMENAALTAVLELPALEEVDITGFWHQGASRDQGGVLQLDQLPGSCPNIRGLTFEFSSDMALGTEGRGPCCSFLKLGRLANLCMYTEFDLVPAHLDIDLPASLAGFTVEAGGDDAADLFWVLREAMKCIRGGAQLRTLSCQDADAFLQPAQWGASLHEQYRRLGGQLSTLSELEVWGGTEPLLRALGAVVSSEPHLSCVKVTITRWPPHMELSPICSAGLKSIIVTVDRPSYRRPPPTVVLTFMPGCTRLQHVCVELAGVAVESTEVKIRCHPCSRSCILPVDAHARLADRWYHRRRYGDACKVTEVGVQFLPGPPSPVGAPPGVHGYTVQYACHATGHQQPLKWGHVVMPGLL